MKSLNLLVEREQYRSLAKRFSEAVFIKLQRYLWYKNWISDWVAEAWVSWSIWNRTSQSFLPSRSISFL